MQNLPSWLPQPLKLPDSHFLGATDLFLLEAQELFLNDFSENNPPCFKNKPIKVDKGTIGDFNYRFWHIITQKSDLNPDKREIKISRCRLTPWILPLLTEGTQNNSVVYWKSKTEQGVELLNKGRSLIEVNWWNDKIGYRMILEDRKYFWKLITAFDFSPEAKGFEVRLKKEYSILQAVPKSSTICCSTLKPEKRYLKR